MSLSTSKKQTRLIPAWVIALSAVVLVLVLIAGYIMFWPRHSDTPLAGPKRETVHSVPSRGVVSQGQASQPQATPDSPANSQPIVPAPPVDRVIPTSTPVTVRLSKLINSGQDTPGSRFPATVVSPITVDGQTIIQPGAGALVRLIEVKKTGFFHRSLKMKLALTGLSINGRIYPTQSQLLQVEPGSDHNDGSGKVLVVLPNTQLTFSLKAPLTVSVPANSNQAP